MLLILILLLGLCACEQQAPTWQEQYDLGVRYLEEGNYEEAIIAFTAAIEIDPKQAPAYVGRGDAYIGSGETEENLEAAQADYEMAIELDGTLVDAYLGFADVYVRKDEKEKAREILTNALECLGENWKIEYALSEIKTYNVYGGVEFTERPGYRSSTDLTRQEISWLETALNAAVNFDEAALEQLAIQCMEETNNQGFMLRTIWNGYKVELDCSLGSYNVPHLDGEFRPENAVGYSFIVDTPGEPTGIAGSSYSGTSRLASCQCVDWQWSGIATITEYTIFMDSYEVDTSILSTGTVPMVNSLRDGDYVKNYTYFTSTSTYSEGMEISRDGEPVEPDNSLWSIITGIRVPSEHTLDFLYW